MENILLSTKNDSIKIILLHDLAWEYRRTIPERAFTLSKEALSLAIQLNDKSQIAKSYSRIASCHYNQGNIEKAKENYLLSLNLYQELGKKRETALMLSNIGNVYGELSNYPLALEYFLKGTKIFEEQKDSISIARNLINIGVVYHDLKDEQEYLEYNFKALAIFEKLNDDYGLLGCLSNIGSLYLEQKNTKEALKYLSRCEKILEQSNDSMGIAQHTYKIGLLNIAQGKYSLALEKLFKSLRIGRKLNDKSWIVAYLLGIVDVYKNLKDYTNAFKYLNECKDLAIEIGNKLAVRDAYNRYEQIYLNTGNYKYAYDYSILYSSMKDAIFNEESQKQITEMQTKYETEKKEQQIKLLNKDKEIQTKDLQRQKTIRNAVAGFLLLVIGFLFVLINRFVLIRKQKKIIETEREKSEKLLLNILPKVTADELKLHNKVIPKSYEMVTVMFTDFKGFTSIAEKMSAEELVNELDFIFKKFDEIISKYHIEKIKTIGDAYMCAGGLPIANTTNPFDIVMAALEIQQFMQEQNKWQLRIGVHTGPVIAGVVGDKKFAYDIWGDTVNTASRMESSGEAGMVNISGETYKHLINTPFMASLQFTFRGKIPAKNKGEVEMYFVEKII